MGTHDDTALSIHEAPSHDGVGIGGIDLREQQGRRIATLAMARRIGAFARQILLLIHRKHVLPETLKRALAMIECLRLDTGLVDGGETVHQILVNLGGALLGDFQAKRNVKLHKERVVIPHGIAVGDGGAGRIAALRLAPHVTQDVVGKVHPDRIRRRRQTLDKVGHLLRTEIQRDAVVLRLRLQAAAKQEGGKQYYEKPFHVVLN